MARKFKVSKLLERARQRTDQENSDFITDAELKGILSSAYGELYSILVDSGMRYFEKTETVTTDGSDSTTLPSDFLATIGVDYVPSASNRRELGELMAQERNLYAGQSGREATAYAVVGQSLKLYPTPPSGQSYEFLYVPQPDDLTDAADDFEIDVVTPDGESFLDAYLQVEIYAKEADHDSVRGSIAKRERARERLEWWATQKALHEHRRPAVTDFDPAGAYGDSSRGSGFWQR